jgi:hypothetical protein
VVLYEIYSKKNTVTEYFLYVSVRSHGGAYSIFQSDKFRVGQVQSTAKDERKKRSDLNYIGSSIANNRRL